MEIDSDTDDIETGSEEFPYVGVAPPGRPVYELVISNFLQKLTPPHGFDLPIIDPDSYFITSGDAIQKLIYICDILWKYAGDARRQLKTLPHTQEAKEFEKLCWQQAGSATKLMNLLIKLRNGAVFLETEWATGHRLLLIPKNPRPRPGVEKI